MRTIPHSERVVKGGLCGIGGGGLGLCSHGMGAGRLRRPRWRTATSRPIFLVFSYGHVSDRCP